jgi:tetratricopeptide (TPR) repeat protein
LYYFQSHVWYYYMTHEFAFCYRYAQKWVDLYEGRDELIQSHPALYLKGIHNLLNALFNVQHHEKFVEGLNKLHHFPEVYQIKRNKNIEGLFNLYKYIHTIKLHFMQGTFDEGLEIIPELEKIIEEDAFNWDSHRVMVFYYRIACLYFGSGDNDRAITYLNKIINQKNPDYRADIQCFARILNLIAHFELGNIQLVEYQVKSVYRFLGKMKDLHAVQREIMRFLRRTPRMQAGEIKEEFIQLKEKLVKWQDEPYEKRPFLYLDIISWLESKIEGCTVKDIIHRKFLKRQR